MTRVSTNRFSYKIGIAVLLGLCFAWLGKQAIESAYHLGESPPEGLNLFSVSQAQFAAQNTLTQSIDQLEVNVWGQERSVLIGRVESLLQLQINQTPFDAQNWRALVEVQAEAAGGVEDRAWTLAQDWKFNNWNESTRFDITHHCVDEYEMFNVVAPRLCGQLIRNLPATSNKRVLARFLGVTEARLAQVLVAEGLRYEELNQ
ncbi:hypothetical protein GCM10008090_17720 [Arenicella chitinivorans]|uniref:Uncharacterized protein n=1 Tax=Arenicella chitinivorans TaxID=1329800 RepID=A0A918RQI9_9GAMM|nr:hypothetical protein [Arenicella chitinivorans]GHA08318.1 hypothetical protein GCM10008090_17720 [Arenicella chitinivorans]